MAKEAVAELSKTILEPLKVKLKEESGNDSDDPSDKTADGEIFLNTTGCLRYPSTLKLLNVSRSDQDLYFVANLKVNNDAVLSFYNLMCLLQLFQHLKQKVHQCWSYIIIYIIYIRTWKQDGNGNKPYVNQIIIYPRYLQEEKTFFTRLSCKRNLAPETCNNT